MDKENIEYIILHLSDLHIFKSTGWKIMQSKYSDLIYDNNIIKCVVITGDLCQYEKDYEETLNFLNFIVEKLKIQKTDVIIVPGNHDSKNFKDKEVYTFYIDKKISNDPDCYSKYFEEVLSQSFNEYNEFVKEFYKDSWEGDIYKKPEQPQVVTWKDKINFLCLNTAINSNGDNELKQVVDISGIGQLVDTLGEVFEKRPTIILAHHYFYDINEQHQDFLKRYITDLNISAYLCGDLHEFKQDIILTNKDGLSSIPCIVCGKSALENGDVYSQTGCILYIKSYNSDKLTAIAYEWNSKRKAFEPSNYLRHDQGQFCFPLLGCDTDSSLIDIITGAAKKVNDKSSISEGRLVRFNDVSDQTMIEMPKLTIEENSVHLTELLQNDRKDNFLLVGKGGWGKTFMLLDTAKNISTADSNVISLYVPLNKLNNVNVTLLDLVCQSIIDESEHKLDRDRFLNWLKSSTWSDGKEPYLLLLLDGYNEITSREITSRIVEEIHSFQVEYPRVRYVITSRYDISEEFTVGHSALTPFVGKEIQPIPEQMVKEYLVKNLGDKFDDQKISPKLLDLLQRPMALMMYIKSQTNENYSLKHTNPQTLGELLDNYVDIILKSNVNAMLKAEKPEVYKKLLDVISYIGYKMNMDGRFDINEEQLTNYFNEAKMRYNLDGKIDCESFLKSPVVNDVLYIPKDFRINNKDSKLMHFFHQDFRDYFCALFLISLLNLSRDEITKVFKNKLSNDVLLLVSEIIGEYEYILDEQNYSKNNSVIQQAMKKFQGELSSDETVAVSQLIEVVKLGRNNRIESFDFSNLDLTTISLNNCKLYGFQNNNAICAKFTATSLSDATFMPVGHAAAVYTICLIENRYLLSFSAESAWCYDMKLLMHYKVANISDNAPIFASAFCSALNIVVTGNRNGTVHIWKYMVDNERLYIELEKDKSFSVNSKIRGLTIVGENDQAPIFLFSTTNGEVFCYFPKTNERSCFFIYDNFDSKLHPLYTGKLMSVCCGKVYVVFGKEVFRIDLPTIGQEPIHSSQITPYYNCTDDGVSFIYDIIVERINRKTVMLLNLFPKNKITDTYKVCEVVGGVLKTTFLESKIITGNNDKGFSGYSVFQKGFDDDFFLGATCESNTTPNLYRICLNRQNLQPNVKPIYGIQTMTIEHIIPVVNNLKDEHDIVTCSADRSVQVLCIDDNRESLIEHLPGHYNGVHALDIISDRDNKANIVIYAAQYSGALSAWKKEGENNLWCSINVFLLHKDWVWDVKHCEHNGNLYLITASYDGTVCVVDAQSEELIGKTKFSDKVLAIEVLTDDTICVAYNTTIQILQINYDAKKLECKTTITPCDEANCRTIKNTLGGLLISAFVKNSSKSDVYKVALDLTYEKYNVQHYKTFDGVIIRSISTLVLDGENEITVYGGTSCVEHQKDIVIVCFKEQTEQFVIESEKPGISSTNIAYYNGVVYLVASSYSSNLYIFSVDISPNLKIYPISRLKYDDQLLDVKISEGMIYVASLSGNVFECSLEEIEGIIQGKETQSCSEFVDINEEFTMKNGKKLFQTMAGFAMNYVDFSRSCKNWSGYVKELIDQYSDTL